MNHYELGKSIVKTLQDEGFIAYFAGGWVRDYLMNNPSSDIDIASDAPPEKVTALFPKTVQVGAQFGVIVVVLEGHSFEVTTFRRDIGYEDGRKPTKIEPSTPQEDALRRDFTINGMFFDPITEQVYDFVRGQEDIKKRVIKTIGNPQERFLEDRLRMIRAVRFATRFDFTIDPETEKAIRNFAPSLFPSVSMERIWQEFNKMNLKKALLPLAKTELLQTIFPTLKKMPNENTFLNYPPNALTISYIIGLFSEKSLESMVEICRYLKTSKRDIQFIEFYFRCKKLVESDINDLYEWSYIYGNPFARESLEILSTRFEQKERRAFLQFHRNREKALEKHIDRIKNQRDVVSSAALSKQGINPGKEMGLLLNEARRLSINEDIDEAEVIIARLKESSLWPK